MAVSEPYFDVLSVCSALQGDTGGVLESEIHLFCYLACSLSLYDGQPISHWGYQFIATQSGHPYSGDLQEVLELHRRDGLIIPPLENDGRDTRKLLNTSTMGEEELSLLSSLPRNTKRSKYLSAACSTVVSLNLGVVRNALTNDTGTREAKAISRSKKLLSRGSIDKVYENFQALRNVVGGETDNLVPPAITWLSYLSEKANT